MKTLMAKKTDHIQMLCDIGEMSTLFHESISIESFLQKIVAMVGDHMHANVCSIYLYDEKTKELTLTATRGLNLDAIWNVRLKLGEGLVGQALKELRPILETSASSSPHFKFFPNIEEEKYDAFLAVPITQGNIRIGVLSVQREEKHEFNEEDLLALRATTNQLASMIENVRILITSKQKVEFESNEEVLTNLKLIKGKSASKGAAKGPVALFSQETSSAFFNQRFFAKKYSIIDFEKAVKETEAQLEFLQEKVEEKLSDVASLIFTVHLLMLKDNEFIGAIKEMIEKGENPPVACLKVGKKFRDIFSASPNLLIREKTQDLEDLLRRLLNNLMDKQYKKEWYEKHIIIANHLLPSDLLKLSSQNVLGIILVRGGVSSHVGILARSLQIPLVIANVPELMQVPEKTQAIVDAESGNIYINPTDVVLGEYEKNFAARENIKDLAKELKKPTKTKDGTSVQLYSNINLLSDLELAKDTFATGIGLYRTEFPFLVRTNFPSEEEQFVIYQKLVNQMKDKPITFRTLDIGGDKVLTYYNNSEEENPAMGLRSIRFSLQHQEVFAQQIRAILRAGVKADLRIMFPMISSLDEFLEAKQVVKACQEELAHKKIPHHKNPRLGVMIEIPSVLDILEELTEYADFFSIGTNDLIQFLLAVDRTNEKVVEFYDPFHPSVMRTLDKIFKTISKRKREVSICGDLAHNENYLPFLLGIGYRNLSLDATYIPKIKKAISNIEIASAKTFSEKLLSCSTQKEIKEYLRVSS